MVNSNFSHFRLLHVLQCFDLLREEQPDFADKLHPIAGDLLEPNMGITPEDQTFLQENIDIIVHLAASIKFNDPLRCGSL